MARPKKAETLLARDENAKETAEVSEQLTNKSEDEKVVVETQPEILELGQTDQQDPIPFLSEYEKNELLNLSDYLNRVHLRSNNISERMAIQSWRELLTTLAAK